MEEKLQSIVFVLKDGRELKIKCKEFLVKINNLYGTLDKYEIKGAVENIPIYVPIKEIRYIYKESI